MGASPRARRTRRVLTLGLLAVCGIVLLVALRSRRPPAPAPREEATASVERVPRLQPLPALASRPPVIDGIEVEKPVVCSGEDNLITVHAHNPDGPDEVLHAVVGSISGWRVPVRAVLGPDGKYVPPVVRVFGPDNLAAQAPVPPFEVQACPERPMVVLSARQMPNTENKYEVVAQIVELPSARDPIAEHPAFHPIEFRWSFEGDGEVSTAVPRVEREITPAPNRLYTSALVGVSARDGSGRTLTGRMSLTVTNKAYQNLSQRGVVWIAASGEPPFPLLGDDGVVRQTFRLHHQYQLPVRITRVVAVDEYLPPGGSGAARGSARAAPPEPLRHPATLPVTSLSSGEEARVPLALDAGPDANVLSRTFEIEGIATDGRPARGSFALMRPPHLPDRAHGVEVTDPAQVERILRARELLGQRYVTDEDIFRLQSEGRLAAVNR